VAIAGYNLSTIYRSLSEDLSALQKLLYLLHERRQKVQKVQDQVKAGEIFTFNAAPQIAEINKNFSVRVFPEVERFFKKPKTFIFYLDQNYQEISQLVQSIPPKSEYVVDGKKISGKHLAKEILQLIKKSRSLLARNGKLYHLLDVVTHFWKDHKGAKYMNIYSKKYPSGQGWEELEQIVDEGYTTLFRLGRILGALSSDLKRTSLASISYDIESMLAGNMDLFYAVLALFKENSNEFVSFINNSKDILSKEGLILLLKYLQEFRGRTVDYSRLIKEMSAYFYLLGPLILEGKISFVEALSNFKIIENDYYLRETNEIIMNLRMKDQISTEVFFRVFYLLNPPLDSKNLLSKKIGSHGSWHFKEFLRAYQEKIDDELLMLLISGYSNDNIGHPRKFFLDMPLPVLKNLLKEIINNNLVLDLGYYEEESIQKIFKREIKDYPEKVIPFYDFVIKLLSFKNRGDFFSYLNLVTLPDFFSKDNLNLLYTLVKKDINMAISYIFLINLYQPENSIGFENNFSDEQKKKIAWYLAKKKVESQDLYFQDIFKVVRIERFEEYFPIFTDIIRIYLKYPSFAKNIPSLLKYFGPTKTFLEWKGVVKSLRSALSDEVTFLTCSLLANFSVRGREEPHLMTVEIAEKIAHHAKGTSPEVLISQIYYFFNRRITAQNILSIVEGYVRLHPFNHDVGNHLRLVNSLLNVGLISLEDLINSDSSFFEPENILNSKNIKKVNSYEGLLIFLEFIALDHPNFAHNLRRIIAHLMKHPISIGRSDIESYIPRIRNAFSALLSIPELSSEDKYVLRQLALLLPLGGGAQLINQVRQDAIDLNTVNNMLGPLRQKIHNWPGREDLDLFSSYLKLMRFPNMELKEAQEEFAHFRDLCKKHLRGGLAEFNPDIILNYHEMLSKTTLSIAEQLVLHLNQLWRFDFSYLGDKIKSLAEDPGHLQLNPKLAKIYSELLQDLDKLILDLAKKNSSQIAKKIGSLRYDIHILIEQSTGNFKAELYYLNLFLESLENQVHTEIVLGYSFNSWNDLQVFCGLLQQKAFSGISSYKANEVLAEASHLIEDFLRSRYIRDLDRAISYYHESIARLDDKIVRQFKEVFGEEHKLSSKEMEEAVSPFYRNGALFQLDQLLKIYDENRGRIMEILKNTERPVTSFLKDSRRRILEEAGVNPDEYEISRGRL